MGEVDGFRRRVRYFPKRMDVLSKIDIFQKVMDVLSEIDTSAKGDECIKRNRYFCKIVMNVVSEIDTFAILCLRKPDLGVIMVQY